MKMEERWKKIISRVNNIPLQPGCYIYRNKADTIIYIGKAKCLRHRVKQYFTGIEQKTGKIALLVNEVETIEYIVTDTELDAIFLECKLIKNNQPKYNTMMKGNPKFVYLKIDLEKDFPDITVVREKKAGAKKSYFGLFYSEKEAVETIELLNSIYLTPACNGRGISKNKKPCFHYYLKKCYGPCGQKISKEEYRQLIDNVIECLNGKTKNTMKKLEQDMSAAAMEMNFEKAAAVRDKIKDLKRLEKKSSRLHINMELKNLFVFLRPFYQSQITVIFISRNQVVHRMNYDQLEDLTVESLTGFVDDIYQENFNYNTVDFMTEHILEVYCDKHFLPIYKKTNAESVAKRLLKASVHMKKKDFEKKNAERS